ncbi:hypothetical protein E2320_020792 [Naja naja]|nr:hypothetical protein E2320_020792 [Naja naja]
MSLREEVSLCLPPQKGIWELAAFVGDRPRHGQAKSHNVTITKERPLTMSSSATKGKPLASEEPYWHEDCLSCDLRGCQLGEVGRRLGTKLCQRSYLRLFGQDGFCAFCEKRIRAYEMTMDKVYHLECFKCAACQKYFCINLLINSDIVCEQNIYEWTKIHGII